MMVWHVSIGSSHILSFMIALAAAQTAFYLAQSEYALSRATDAVAVKSRSAAVCDAYANQGARSAAILPFTSALSGLCAAATAAIVELPFLETLSAAGTLGGLSSEMAVVGFFPAFSSLFAAAASVSKARCEVQAEAATQAASTLALEYSPNEDQDPILRPWRGVIELIQVRCNTRPICVNQADLDHVLTGIPRFKYLAHVRKYNKGPTSEDCKASEVSQSDLKNTAKKTSGRHSPRARYVEKTLYFLVIDLNGI